MVPLVLACASVWQLPHDFWNITLPLTRLAVGCLTAQPPTASITPTPAMSRIAVRRSCDGQRSISQAALYPFKRRAGAPTKRPMPSDPLVASAGMRLHQRYRMRTPSTGREVIIQAEPDQIYRDRETGEELEVVAQLLPLAPTPSELPWTVENLRFCNWCDQLAQKDLNDCPVCGRRMEPLGS